ncbi:MAG: hypothetical protein K6B65_03545 [Bacilli bacterium]|nr:hypothetical protein [Bacilli bacterium]
MSDINYWGFVLKYAKGKKWFFPFSVLLATVKVGLELVPFFMLPNIIDAVMAGNDEISFYLARFAIIFSCLVGSLKNITVLDEGKIVEEGTHEELIANNGLYSHFVKEREEAIGFKL